MPGTPILSFAMAPLDDPTNYAGPFTRMGTTTKLSRVTDGLSQTIFFGEVRPSCWKRARRVGLYEQRQRLLYDHHSDQLRHLQRASE